MNTKMKYVLTVMVVYGCSASGLAQISPTANAIKDDAPAGPNVECGTRIDPAQVPDMLQLQAMGFYDGAMQERYILYVPLTMHIVRLSTGTGGMTQTNIDATLVDANGHWIGSGIQFFQSGATRFIDNDNFYQNIDTQAEIDSLRNTDVIGGTVNVYFTPNLADEIGGLCGQGTFTTTGGSQGVAMKNGCTNGSGNTATFAHELGHYFDLYHTHEVAFGLECPNGSNCGSAGDLLCDTAADPDVSTAGYLSGCTYVGNATRCGSGFNPDPTNLMSYGASCRTHFVYGQNSRALSTLVNLRSNLIAPPGLSVTWVDFFYGGSTNGSFNQPFNNLGAAVNAVATGGRIVMKSSSAYQTLTITKACTLDSFRGTATVGQ